jgi:uncharacterized repeat protein (TIGR01451 family)
MRAALSIILGVAAAAAIAAPANAATDKETPAGTLAGRWIPSAANVQFSIQGERDERDTNNTFIQVAELVAFDLNVAEEGKVGAISEQEYEYEFEITNVGNGQECFATTPVDSNQGALDITPTLLESDADDDRRHDGASEPDVAFGACAVWLAPGQTERLFIKGRMPKGIEADRAYFSIVVAPGPGLANIGTVFENQGDEEADALSATHPNEGYATFYAQGSTLRVGLRKSAVVHGDASRTDALPGEMVAYSLHFSGEGEGMVTDAVVTDPLPANLSYVPGSLQLDGAALTDATGDDAGSFADGNVAVRIGDRIAPFDNLITFQAVVLATAQP